MFEFFIALFGGLFYGNKYSREKAKEKEYYNERISRESLYNDILARYGASSKLESDTRELIKDTKRFKDVCFDLLSEDFFYAIGADWKERVFPSRIMLRPDDFKSYIPFYYISDWAYHLLLARSGKIDRMRLTNGYTIGGLDYKDIDIRFAECIEKHLINSGVQGVRLALELDDIVYGRRRSPSEVCGGHIKIETLSYFPTHRLWNDYIKK